MIPSGSSIGRGMALGTRDIFSPKKSVIVDMMMVQVLTTIVTFSLILLTSSDALSSDTIAWMMGGLMISVLMAGAIYSRISDV